MPSITLKSKCNLGNGLAMSPSSILSEYFHGIPISDINAKNYSIKDIERKIKQATTWLETFLGIKVTEQEREESQDYILMEWQEWGHIKCEYTVNELMSIEGIMNLQKVCEFPVAMWVLKGKNIALVPGANGLQSHVYFATSGTFPLLRAGVAEVPNFWHIKYKTGFKIIPYDILQAIGKLASIQIFAILGDIKIGAGIASQSVSFDGFSQSVSTNQGSKSLYGARIDQYTKELTEMNLPNLKGFYKGLIFEAL